MEVDEWDAAPAGREQDLYGLLDTDERLEVLVPRLAAAGWSVRETAWAGEYELADPWSRLIVGQPGGAIKIVGALALGRLDHLASVLQDVRVGYTLELYDGNELVRRLVRAAPLGAGPTGAGG